MPVRVSHSSIEHRPFQGLDYVQLRLAPRGVKHSPVYDVVAVRQSKRVAAQPIEVLGRYDPIPKLVRPATRNLLQPLQEPQWEKELVLNSERVGYWLSVGAQPSERVRWLLKVVSVSYSVLHCASVRIVT